MNKTLNKTGWWTAALLWAGVIYWFPSQSDLASGFEPLFDTVLRTIAHAAEFFVLAYLLFQANWRQGASKSAALVLATIMSIGYAGADEYHQSIVAGRVAAFSDVLIDTAGVLGHVGLQSIIFYHGKRLRH